MCKGSLLMFFASPIDSIEKKMAPIPLHQPPCPTSSAERTQVGTVPPCASHVITVTLTAHTAGWGKLVGV